MLGQIIGLIIAGLIVGALGRLFHPGADNMSVVATILVGIASVLGVGLLLEGSLGFWGYVLAVIVAIVLVALIARAWPEDKRVRA